MRGVLIHQGQSSVRMRIASLSGRREVKAGLRCDSGKTSCQVHDFVNRNSRIETFYLAAEPCRKRRVREV